MNENLSSIPNIETKRLRLRAWRQADFQPLSIAYADPNFMKFIGNGVPLSPQESWRSMAMMIGHWHLKGFGLWAVEDKITNEFVGRIGLFEPEGWPAIEIGWGIVPEHWGKGYAYEGALAVKQWAFDQLKLDALISIIHPDNLPSIALAKKLGALFSHQENIGNSAFSIYKMTLTSSS
ncbi:GNAT family N-acetyltransferase [Pseudoalteromonas xiamenensis]